KVPELQQLLINELKGQMTRRVRPAEPYADIDCIAIDNIHTRHLLTSFFRVSLMDAQGVDPQVALFVLVAQGP
ncbi:MAG TPA: hypothetical protein VHV10_20505, partial [Ktedonobacteraceae bacterium]|nr:hypothetical protein [Ktedonobacteraceae bacterium]